MLTNTAPTVTLAPPTLPNGTVASPYTATLHADGGTVPYSFTVTVGALPDGLTLATDGVISGAPTAPISATFTVQAKDARQLHRHAALSITIVTPIGQTYTVGTTSDNGGAATFAVLYEWVEYNVPTA